MRPPPNDERRARAFMAPAAAAVSGVLVGAATVATRSVVNDAGPITLALLRYAIGVCCLLPPVLIAARVPFAARDLLPIGLLGIGQFGILIVLLNYALQSMPAARAALLFATMPLLTLLVGAALHLEAMTRAKSAGVLLTVAGVGLAVGVEKALRPGGAQAWTGEAAAFGSALVGAGCSMLYRPYLRRYPTLQVSAVAMLASVAFLGVAAALHEDVLGAGLRLTASGWLAVAFIGVSSGVGYFLWLWALGHTTPTRVTVFLALSPVTAAGLGAVLLGEQLSAAALLGLVAVVLGLWLAHRPDPRDDSSSVT